MKNRSTGRLGGLFKALIPGVAVRGVPRSVVALHAVTLEGRCPGSVVINKESGRDPGLRHSRMTLFDNSKATVCRAGLFCKGFTLIELLVVVLIIGILAAIALPQYQRAVARSHITTLLPLMRAINDAQFRYKMANGEYATNFANLDIEMPGSGTFKDPTYWVHDNYVCFLYSKYSVYCGFRNIQIEKYYDLSDYWCWAPKEDKTAISVCQVLSGKSSPDSSGRDNRFFVFYF